MHQRAHRLARQQHEVVGREQLLALGFTRHAIAHRVKHGRLFRIHEGVYAVGRPTLTRHGRWMAAVLACGPEAALSHGSAAALYGIAPEGPAIHVSIPLSVTRRRPGLTIHRRAALSVTKREGIRVTTPAQTLVDLAATRTRDETEAAVNAADRADLIDPERLREALDRLPRMPGTRALRTLLDRHTFQRTDSTLERRFRALCRNAKLPPPTTQRWFGRERADFFWPELGLVVETDGLRYHRTPAQQASDRRRDQLHTAAGRTPLRFTHGQISYEREHVASVLATVIDRLQRARIPA